MNAIKLSKLLGGLAVVSLAVAGLPRSRRPLFGDDSPAPRVVRSSVLPEGAAAPQGGARLKATFLQAADGARQFLGWHDVVLDVDCSFRIAADRAWRCLPSGAVAGRFFSDAGCTRLLAVVAEGCTVPAYAVLDEASLCGRPSSTRHVFELGARLSGPVVYWKAGDSCQAVPSGELAAQFLYEVGGEASASSFVEATLQAEP